jgi:hypothetical protein
VNALLALVLAVTVAAPTSGFTLRTWAQARGFLAASGRSQVQEFAISGGLGNGKTLGVMLGTFDAGDRLPGVRIAYCRDEASTLRASAAQDFRDLILAPLGLSSWHGGYGWKESEGAGAFYFPKRNGRQSVIRFVGLDDPDRLMSTNYWRMVFEQAEQLSFDQFMRAKSRAARMPEFSNGGVVSIFNPDHPRHWANQRYRFNEEGSREFDISTGEEGSVHAEVVVCDPDDVFLFATPEYAAEVRSWEGVYRDRWYLGKWVEAEGTAFPMWRPNAHVCDAPAAWARWGGCPPPDWPRYRGIDFGWRNPFACLTWTRDPEGCFWLYRQRMRCERLAEDHARDILADERRELATLRAHVQDEDEARALRPYLNRLHVVDSRHDPADPEDAATLNRHGVTSRAGLNDVEAGIKLVATMLTRHTLRVVRGSLIDPCPILRQRREPMSLEEELPAQRWLKLPDSVNPVADRRELLVDEKNHAYKTLHYLFLTLAQGKRAGVWA